MIVVAVGHSYIISALYPYTEYSWFLEGYGRGCTVNNVSFNNWKTEHLEQNRRNTLTESYNDSRVLF